jgi:hypothetical protein
MKLSALYVLKRMEKYILFHKQKKNLRENFVSPLIQMIDVDVHCFQFMMINIEMTNRLIFS